MLTKIENLPPHVLGIQATGEVTAEDMNEVLRPALDELANRTGKLNYLLVLDTPVQEFTAGAWWQDMLAGLKHFTDWNRIAVVTGQPIVETFTDLFELGVPGRSKGFKPGELEAAKSWVSQTANEPFKPISPKAHALIDYALVGALLTLPSLLKMNKKAKLIYAAEAAVLLPYVALTEQPVAVKGLIPMETHGKIDPFNVAQFAAQTFFKPFHKTRKELIFNVAFTAIAGLTVLLTNYQEKRYPYGKRL